MTENAFRKIALAMQGAIESGNGQAGVGDIFEWFVAHGVAGEYAQRAAQRNISMYQLLEEEAARQQRRQAHRS